MGLGGFCVNLFTDFLCFFSFFCYFAKTHYQKKNSEKPFQKNGFQTESKKAAQHRSCCTEKNERLQRLLFDVFIFGVGYESYDGSGDKIYKVYCLG